VATGRELLEDLRRRDLILGRDLRLPEESPSAATDRAFGGLGTDSP
jgi:hypothetical protein